MAKDDVVSTQKAAILAGEDASLTSGLGACYDSGFTDGVASVPATPGGLTQDQLDAAVKAVQDELDALTAKEQLEEASVAALQSKLDGIKAILSAA